MAAFVPAPPDPSAISRPLIRFLIGPTSKMATWTSLGLANTLFAPVVAVVAHQIADHEEPLHQCRHR